MLLTDGYLGGRKEEMYSLKQQIVQISQLRTFYHSKMNDVLPVCTRHLRALSVRRRSAIWPAVAMRNPPENSRQNLPKERWRL